MFGGLKQQTEQGYDFLLWLTRQDRFNHLVALSGLSKRFLMTSFRKNNLRVNVYSKNDLIGNGVNIFADDIEVFGDEVNQIICDQPMSKAWKTIKPFYIYHRNSRNYRSIEQEISIRARSLIAQARRITQFEDSEMRSIHDIDQYGKLTTNLINKLPGNEEAFEAYKEKMIARRVAYWLINFEFLNRREIAALLQKGRLDATAITSAFEKQIIYS